MTTPTPTLPESAADVVPDDAVAGVKSRLMRALQTMSNDDCSMPGSKLRERHIERSAAILGAVEFLDALASRSTQPEGETGPVPWANVRKPEDGPPQIHEVTGDFLTDFALKSDIRPEAAASGDVPGIELLVESLYGAAVQAGRMNDPSSGYVLHVKGHLLTAIRSLAAQARAQALEEAADVAEGSVGPLLRGEKVKADSSPAAMLALALQHDLGGGRDAIAAAIRALIPQPSAPADKAPQGWQFSDMTDAELVAADLDYRQQENGDWEGSGSPLETFYERWSDIVQELHRRGLNAPSDTEHGTRHRVDQPEPGSTQGGETR